MGVIEHTFLGLLLAPVIGMLMAWGSRRSSRRIKRWIAIAATASVLLAMIISFTPYSFVSYNDDARALICGYIGFSYLVTLAFKSKGSLVTRVAGVLGAAVICFGWFMGTIGALGTLFIVGDTLPLHSEKIGTNSLCEVTSYGNATTTEGGYVAILKHTYASVPIEREVIRKSFSDNRYPAITKESVCKLAQYNDL